MRMPDACLRSRGFETLRTRRRRRRTRRPLPSWIRISFERIASSLNATGTVRAAAMRLRTSASMEAAAPSLRARGRCREQDPRVNASRPPLTGHLLRRRSPEDCRGPLAPRAGGCWRRLRSAVSPAFRGRPYARGEPTRPLRETSAERGISPVIGETPPTRSASIESPRRAVRRGFRHPRDRRRRRCSSRRP